MRVEPRLVFLVLLLLLAAAHHDAPHIHEEPPNQRVMYQHSGIDESKSESLSLVLNYMR